MVRGKKKIGTHLDETCGDVDMGIREQNIMLLKTRMFFLRKGEEAIESFGGIVIFNEVINSLVYGMVSDNRRVTAMMEQVEVSSLPSIVM